MNFLPETDLDRLNPEQEAAATRQISLHGGRITNMKATLLGHVPSFDAYMEWYTLADELVPHIGERGVNVLSHAVSDANDCLVCSVYFRRIFIDAGEDPDHLQLTAEEQLLEEWGRLVARSPDSIPEHIYERMEAAFEPEVRLILVAFAGLMVATNLLNTVGRIPLDDVLYRYRKPGDTRER